MEQAIQKAGRSKYGHEHDIRAKIDRKNGEIRLMRFRQVVEPVENEATQLTLAEAQRIDPETKLGDFIIDPLPPIDFGRIAAQTAKQVIVQKVREAERKRQFDEYKDRIGEIVNGLVKRVEFGNVTVDLGRAEAILRRDELLPRETFRTATACAPTSTTCARRRAARRSSCRAPIRISWPSCSRRKCRRSTTASSRSRRSPAIPAAAPRSRSSPTTAASIRSAPASACAAAASRRWSASCRARRSTSSRGRTTRRPSWSTRWPRPRSPRSCSTRKRAASKSSCRTTSCRWRSAGAARTCGSPRMLTGWDIDILTEAEESERRSEEFRTRSQMFIDALDVDDVIAHLLVTEGFTRSRRWPSSPVEELAGIEGFDEDVAGELQERAREVLSSGANEKLTEQR